MLFPQGGNIFVEANYNTFSHGSLKEFQQEFVDDVPEVDLRINDDFPSNFGFTVGYRIDPVNISIFGSFNSTGGKISYSDYSGTIRLTQPLNGYTFGGVYEIYLGNQNNLSLGLKGFSTYSSLKIISFNEIANSTDRQELKLHSIDYGIGASLIYEYPVGFITLRASAGFDFVLGGKLFFNDEDNLYVENNNGDPVRTGWTGLRTGIGVAIPL